jgi:hypothetical protein
MQAAVSPVPISRRTFKRIGLLPMTIRGCTRGIRSARAAPMSIGLKLMPGVRIRVGHRGVRAGIGPRIARVHVGAGRAGLSTGLGPLSLYASLGGSRRRRPSSSTSAAQHRVNIQQAERAEIARQTAARESAALESAARLAAAGVEAQAQMNEAAERAMRSLKALTHVHLESFDTVTRPIAKLPNQRMSDAEVIAWYERAELKDVGAFDRVGRKAARERARTVAAEQLAAQRTGAEEAQARRRPGARRRAHTKARRSATRDGLVVVGRGVCPNVRYVSRHRTASYVEATIAPVRMPWEFSGRCDGMIPSREWPGTNGWFSIHTARYSIHRPSSSESSMQRVAGRGPPSWRGRR